MALDLGGMAVDVVRAESSRFRHPLLLLHGAWTGGWIWRDLAPYLAHRGWDAWIPSFLAAGLPAMDLEARRSTLLALCRDLPAAPIVVTHDACIAVAETFAGDARIPAIVAITPLPAKAEVFRGPRYWLARAGARNLPPPSGHRAQALFADLTDADLARISTDSSSLQRALVSAPSPSPIEGLVVASRRDPAVSLAQCERLAQARGWSLEMHDTATGHFPMLGASATTLGDRLHRWLVHALGRDLLAWIDDENADE